MVNNNKKDNDANNDNENGIYNATHRFLENDTGNVENSHTK